MEIVSGISHLTDWMAGYTDDVVIPVYHCYAQFLCARADILKLTSTSGCRNVLAKMIDHMSAASYVGQRNCVVRSSNNLHLGLQVG